MRKWKTVVLIAVLLIIAILVGNMLFFNRFFNKENKKAVVTIMNNIQIGDTKDKVKTVYNLHKTRGLELLKSEDHENWKENEWLIRMPLEFGATDWILWIGFEGDKVISLKIRLSDSKTMKPKAAPDDKTGSLAVLSESKRSDRPLPIAIEKAKELGFNPDEMDIRNEDKNSKLDEENPTLKNRNYQAVYFSPKQAMKGGDLWIFVDKDTGKVISYIMGE